jgi:elongation factor G
MTEIPRKETITRTGEAEYVHKRQLDSRGEFAVVRLRLEPLPRGDGIAFADATAGEVLPRAFILAIEAAIRRCAAAGGIEGYPVIDFRAVLVDGKYHEIDSNERIFALAAEGAFHEALRKCGPIILLR